MPSLADSVLRALGVRAEEQDADALPCAGHQQQCEEEDSQHQRLLRGKGHYKRGASYKIGRKLSQKEKQLSAIREQTEVASASTLAEQVSRTVFGPWSSAVPSARSSNVAVFEDREDNLATYEFSKRADTVERRLRHRGVISHLVAQYNALVTLLSDWFCPASPTTAESGVEVQQSDDKNVIVGQIIDDTNIWVGGCVA